MVKQYKSKLIGRIAMIPEYDGTFGGNWGRIVDYDGEYYYVAFAGDENNVMVFMRNEIRVKRDAK